MQLLYMLNSNKIYKIIDIDAEINTINFRSISQRLGNLQKHLLQNAGL